jgi:hypothetical protein
MSEVLSFVIPPGAREMLGVAAMLSTSAGIWLRFRLPTHLSELEEAVKDRKLQPEQARQRARRVHRRASGLVTIGLLMLLLTAFGWSA